MVIDRKHKFEGFERKDIVFDTINSHKLWSTVLTPETISGQPDRQLPVLVFWHGGGFVCGDRMYEPWWPQWLLEFALSQEAMIISPDYRLLPEATGSDVLDDMVAFWRWFVDSLPDLAVSERWEARPDPERILCVGSSAGGSIAVHSALECPQIRIKAVVSLYGPLCIVPELKMSRPRMIGGIWPPPPRQAEAKIRAYIERTKGTIRTSSDPAEMWELVTCIMQQGWIPRLLKKKPDERLDTIATVEQKRNLPPIWLVHGEEDSVVPVGCSVEFAKHMSRLHPELPVHLSFKRGDHTFDASLSMDEVWIREGCDFLLKHW